MISLQTDKIHLSVSPHGAEPRFLRDATGRELLWQAADPWNRSACILFPAVCRHEGDVIRAATAGGATDEESGGPTWPIPKHGLARDLDFEVVESDDTHAVLELTSTDDTLRAFPWDFALRVEYTVEDTTVTTQYTVTNRTNTDHGAGTDMPYALGSHPAFVWPLPTAADAGVEAAKETGCTATDDAGGDSRGRAVDSGEALHVIEFEAPTPRAFQRLEADLLLPELHDTNEHLGAAGSLVPLRREFFDSGAVLFPEVVDTAVVYRRLDGEGPRIGMSWEGFDTLTLWSAPGGDFVCIEPWAGRPQEVGSTTPDTHRSDLQHLEPGSSRTHVYRISVS